MTLEVSTPISGDPGQRRLYFSCKCGMIAARNESEAGDIKTSNQPNAVKGPAQDETAESRIFIEVICWIRRTGSAILVTTERRIRRKHRLQGPCQLANR
jgi:hypothetical protein